MPEEKKKDNLERVIFGKKTNAEQIADAIVQMQDDWAKKYPRRAHELYPTVYDENGNRIKSDE